MSRPEIPGPPGPPPADLLRARRDMTLDRIGDGVLLVAAAPELVRSRDTEVPYRQNPDLYYLTGFEEPASLALLTPHDPEHRFTLFLRPRDPDREVWNGPRLGLEQAREATGADAVYPIDEAWQRLPELVRAADCVYSSLGSDAEHDRRLLETLARARLNRPRSGTGPTALVDLDCVLGEMRKVKDDHELARMRTAARIAAEGHLAAMRRAGPNVGEWEVEAALEATFRALGAGGPAFPSIVGSGPNATVLHYTANARRAGADDLLLVDAGAQWGMYCSDITRTFPTSGRFTPAQREVYEVVLAAERAGIEAARPGSTVQAIHEAAVRILVDGMLHLGILRAASADQVIESGSYRRFYMHQTSHWLGLDVHDVGLYRDRGAPVPLQPGMVLTVEPGLYISAESSDVPAPFRGIGVRIEDTVAVTAAGREVLTGAVPSDPATVESLVGTG